MSKTGRHVVYKLDLKSGKMIPKEVIEPINENPDRNAPWLKGMSNAPKGGAIKEKDSIITEANGFKNIRYK